MAADQLTPRCMECGCDRADVINLAEYNGYTGPDPICCETIIEDNQ